MKWLQEQLNRTVYIQRVIIDYHKDTHTHTLSLQVG